MKILQIIEKYEILDLPRHLFVWRYTVFILPLHVVQEAPRETKQSAPRGNGWPQGGKWAESEGAGAPWL